MLLGFKPRFVKPIKQLTKIHTIRKGYRWKAGNVIHMATGIRTKNYVQFNKGIAELSVCKSVQKIDIFRVDDLPFHLHDDYVYVLDYYVEKLKETFQMSFRVQVDGKFISKTNIRLLAINDGFDSPEELFEWFGYKDFNGQIIHWTDFRY